VAQTRAAVVFTAVDRLPDNRMSGYWLPEAAYPWLALAAAGWSVASVSTVAAPPRPGGVDRTDRVQRQFLDTPAVRDALAGTCRPEQLDPADFGVVVFAGGPGAVFDLPGDDGLARFTSGVRAGGGLLASCGYGVAGLLGLAERDGDALRGVRLTATAPAEQSAAQLDGVLPVHVVDALTARGALVEFGDPFRSHVVADGRVLTGQNPASAPLLARQLTDALSARAAPS
jgi:putative intracellular protease/amidase